ncbi:MAG: hypothetical protein WA642_20195 [Steroidobacteraceae bacterium]
MADENDDSDPGREGGNDGIGNVLDDRAQTGDAEYQQDDPGHQRGDLQPGDAMLGGNDGEHGDESARGPGNLYPGSAEDGRQQRSDDCRIQSLLRPRARCDREGHCQRQRHDTHHDTGQHIVANLGSRPQSSRFGLEQCNRWEILIAAPKTGQGSARGRPPI